MNEGLIALGVTGTTDAALRLASRAVAHGLTTAIAEELLSAADLAGPQPPRSKNSGEQGGDGDGPALLRRVPAGDLYRVPVLFDTRGGDLAAKRAWCAALEPLLSRQTVLVICVGPVQSVTSIAAAAEHPERVVGLHLIEQGGSTMFAEVVAGMRTGGDALQVALDLMRRLGIPPASVNDTPGLIVARVGAALQAEAVRVAAEGTAATVIDRIICAGAGMPVGPLQAMDDAGLDTALAISDALFTAHRSEPRYRAPALLTRLVDAGYTGRAAGRGFHEYDHGSR